MVRFGKGRRAESRIEKVYRFCEEFPSVSMLCGVCQNGGFRRDTNVETSTGLLVGFPNGVLQRYELVYQLGSADSECSYFGSFGRLESSETTQESGELSGACRTRWPHDRSGMADQEIALHRS